MSNSVLHEESVEGTENTKMGTEKTNKSKYEKFVRNGTEKSNTAK